MSAIIVTDAGFGPDSHNGTWIDLPVTADPETLRPLLGDQPAIRIAFASFADGRGFTLAARLRRMGFVGRLRATGHVLADQYAMARRSGFDEVEIDTPLAARQPEPQWLARANWQDHDYRRQLGRRS
jgi:uncharacterized protein (DUF934 family)